MNIAEMTLKLKELIEDAWQVVEGARQSEQRWRQSVVQTALLRVHPHVAVAIPAGLVVRADGHEARILAACAGVGLQRHLVEARDLRQLRRQVLWIARCTL